MWYLCWVLGLLLACAAAVVCCTTLENSDGFND